MLRRCSRSVLLILFVLGTVACRTAGETIEAYQGRAIELFVIITSDEIAESAAVSSFVAAKRSQGFRTELLTVARAATASRPTPESLSVIRSGLAALRPAEGELAYALILGGQETISMGPWEFEGLDEAVPSDLPYFLDGAIDPRSEIPEALWMPAYERDFPWVMGRIPFSKPEDLARVFAATRRFGARPGDRSRALFGGERWSLWGDSSLILDRARAAAEDRGWEAFVVGEDAPADLTTAGHDADSRDEELVFLRAWRSYDPQFVLTVSHANTQSIGGALVPQSAVSPVEYENRALLAFLAALGGQDSLASAYASAYPMPAPPPTPAILFAAGCYTARGYYLWRLFQSGWICGFAGYTDIASPLPLFTSINAEVNMAEVIAAGLPGGLALRVIREEFFDAAAASPSYWLLGVVRRHAKRNILGSVYYGDPSLAATRAPQGAGL